MKTTRIMQYIAPFALLGVLALPVMAQTGNINAREHRQNQRIRQGVHSGELTRREANRLRTREARTRFHEARDRMTGGHISPREHRQLERQLNRDSHAIYRQKHDGQVRH